MARSKRMTGSYLQFKDLIAEQDVDRILELGSRDGLDAILLRDHFDAEVASFECNPPQIRVCENRLKFEDRIELIPKAVWHTTGEIPFYPVINGNHGASSAYKADTKYPYENYVQAETMVPCIRLDEWIEETGFEPDLICMDLQGSEMAALRGMGRKLAGVKYIISEVQFTPLYHNTPTMEDLTKFLDPWNFHEHTTIGTNSWFGDALYVRKLAGDNYQLPYTS